MTTSEAIAHYGSAQKLAEALCIHRQSVYKWGDTPPIDRQCEIEVRTSGALRADVPDSDRAA